MSVDPEGNIDRSEIKMEDDEAVDEGEREEEGGLVLDDTSEFVRALRPAPIVSEPARPSGRTPTPGIASVKVKAEPEDVALSEMVATRVEDEPEEGEAEDPEAAMMVDHQEDEKPDVKPDVKAAQHDAIADGTAGEQFVGRGVASTLSMLRQQGLLKTRTPEEIEHDKEVRRQALWQAERRRQEREREKERAAQRAAGAAKSQEERERDNRRREQEAGQRDMELFKDYKPDVDIKYHDEFGRNLTPKEAWKCVAFPPKVRWAYTRADARGSWLCRALSHKFHGKSSGAAKTEKRLKKIEEERKRVCVWVTAFLPVHCDTKLAFL
jgi:U4/U6.U5 tri-snRNP-associated protein 1